MDGHVWPLAQWGLTDDELKRMKEEIRLHPPMAITVSSGQITQIIPIYQDRAIEILRQMIKETYYFDQDFGMLCFFCEKPKGKSHTNDCPYILSQQLLNEIDYGRTQTKIP